MGRVYYRECLTCQRELSPRHVGRVPRAIYRKSVLIEQFKCICGCLLYIEYPIIQLLHPCSTCERHRDKLGCAKCLTVLKAMIGDSDYDREGLGDAFWSILPIGEMAKT